jgi:ABC-2 type transport system permease protein
MIKLTLKDLKLFFADKRAMMLTFAVPIALITLFAFAFGGAGKSNDEVRRTDLVIADEDKTIATAEVITKLDSLKEFNVIRTSSDSAEQMVKKGDQAAVIIFHKGFADSLSAGNKPPIEMKYDAARETEVMILGGALTGNLVDIIGSKTISKNIVKQFDESYPDMDTAMRASIHAEILKNFGGNGAKTGSPQPGKRAEYFLKSTPLVAEKENSPGLIHAVAGTSIMMLLFAVVGMGASLLEEKEEGTLKKLLYAPVNPNRILFGKMIYVNIISIFQLAVMFVFAKIFFGLDIFSHIPALVLMIICTAYACSSFGVLLASFAKTRQQVQGISTLVILVMSCIGGSMIPVFIMPVFMQKMSVFSVNYWGIQGFYDIFWRMFSITNPTFLSRIVVLLCIGTGMNLLATVMYKRNILDIAR